MRPGAPAPRPASAAGSAASRPVMSRPGCRRSTSAPCPLDGSPHPDALVRMPLAMLNRHGLIAGATGTGKTKTLQLIAEQLSAAGVPVVLADLKGDLAGLVQPGETGDRVTRRAADTGDAWAPTGFPVEFLSLGGLGTGVPVRATITDFGPVLLSKVLDLNDTQESSLGLVFHYADQAGLPLLDLKDLRAVLNWLTSDEGKADLKGLGGLSPATAGVILRELIGLEELGGDVYTHRPGGSGRGLFFGEPAWEPADLLRTAPDGRGVISAVELKAVQDRPALFSTFLMWLLAELFEELPEVGDLDRPEAGVLLRRGPPAVHRREQGLPRGGHPDRAPDPVQGRRRLLRHPEPDGRPQLRARSAGQPGAARAAHVHPGGRRRAPQDRAHVPRERRLRPRRPADRAGHRRGSGHRPVRARTHRRPSRGR